MSRLCAVILLGYSNSCVLFKVKRQANRYADFRILQSNGFLNIVVEEDRSHHRLRRRTTLNSPSATISRHSRRLRRLHPLAMVTTATGEAFLAVLGAS